MAAIARVFIISLVLLGTAALTAAQTTPSRAHSTTPAKKTRTVLVSTGKITSFDAATNTLVLATPRGEQQFVLGSPAPRVLEGRKTIGVEQLASLTGHDAHVRYAETGGQKTVQSIRVESASKSAKATKVTKAPKATKSTK